jgi:hypothetical protein
MTGPVNPRVMLLEPRDSKDNGVAVEDCRIEGQVFVVLLDLELRQALARDYFLLSIGHGEIIRGGLGRHSTGFEVGTEVVRVDKIACGSRIYHSIRENPSITIPYF